jgi:hypothetical protein
VWNNQIHFPAPQEPLRRAARRISIVFGGPDFRICVVTRECLWVVALATT